MTLETVTPIIKVVLIVKNLTRKDQLSMFTIHVVHQSATSRFRWKKSYKVKSTIIYHHMPIRKNTSKNVMISKEVNILYLNILSLRRRKAELQLLLHSHPEVDVIVLNEIWIYRSEVQFFELNGFNSIFNCRDSNRGGGSAIFVKSSIPFQVVKEDDQFNTILIELLLEDKFKLMTCYRSPSYLKDEIETYVNHMESYLNSYENLVFIGDTNIDLMCT